MNTNEAESEHKPITQEEIWEVTQKERDSRKRLCKRCTGCFRCSFRKELIQKSARSLNGKDFSDIKLKIEGGVSKFS